MSSRRRSRRNTGRTNLGSSQSSSRLPAVGGNLSTSRSRRALPRPSTSSATTRPNVKRVSNGPAEPGQVYSRYDPRVKSSFKRDSSEWFELSAQHTWAIPKSYPVKRSTAADVKGLRADLPVKQQTIHRTQSDLRNTLSRLNQLDTAYDMDGDGEIDQTDVRLVKMLGLDADGVIDDDERQLAKRTLSKEFFDRHPGDLWMFAPEWKDGTSEENAQKLAAVPNFFETHNALKEKEHIWRLNSSEGMWGSLAGSHPLCNASLSARPDIQKRLQSVQQSRPSSRQRMRMEQASARSSGPSSGGPQQDFLRISDGGPNSPITTSARQPFPEPACSSPKGGSGVVSGRRSGRESRGSSRAESSECALSNLGKKEGWWK